jgi:hypothetical protein
MTDKQILAWLKSQHNGAYWHPVNLRQLIEELEALIKTLPEQRGGRNDEQ